MYFHLKWGGLIKIKICGITNEKEIEYLNILKPDYIGFVFTDSRRKINPYKAAALREELNPYIKCVAVFRNNSIAEIKETLKVVKPDIVQLHGSENYDFAKSVKSVEKENDAEFEIWKALSLKDELLLKEYLSYYIGRNDKTVISNILFDGSNPGSGETYSLAPLKKILKEEYDELSKDNFKFILAGGITCENVLSKIKEAHPWGVDVSSGVEEADSSGFRYKSFHKMKDLICKVREIY